ncbi:MAG: ABC transporter permease, partial [Solirubrobacteraceae bacterium]
MLAAGLRVIRADLRTRPLHTVLTGLVVGVALGALVVTLHGRATLEDPYDRLFRATDGAHVTAISPSREDLARIAALPGVAASEGPRPLVRVPVRFHGQGDMLGLIGLPRTPARVEHPLILDGRTARGPGEVVLPREFARGHGIRVGDTLAAGVGTTRRNLRVVGLGSAAGSGDGAWADPADVLGLATAEQPLQFALGLRLTDPAAAKAFALRALGSAPDGSVRTLDWRTQRAERTDDARRLLTILQTTTVLALLAAAFTLATAIGGRVLAQRRQIGLLRAIALTPSQVTWLLVAHYLVLAALAAPFGLVGGAFVAERLSASAADALGAPAHPPPSLALLAIALLVALAVVAVATALPAWRAGRMPVQAALALGRGATSARASRVAGLALRLHLPVVVGVGAKDAFAQRGRTLLTVSSLALAAALVATAMSFEATMDRLASDPALRAQPYELRVESTLPPATVERLLARRGEVTAVARVREIVMTGRGRMEIHARVLDGPMKAFPYAIRDGRAARAPGEVTLGRGALVALHARIVERIALRAGGKPVSLRVVGRHVEPDDEGRGAVTSLSGLPAGTAKLDDPYWAIRLSAGADPVATAAALVREVGGRLSAERPIESLQ